MQKLLPNAVGEHKVPNVGWCAVEPTRSSDLFQSMPDAPDFISAQLQMICKVLAMSWRLHSIVSP